MNGYFYPLIYVIVFRTTCSRQQPPSCDTSNYTSRQVRVCETRSACACRKAARVIGQCHSRKNFPCPLCGSFLVTKSTSHDRPHLSLSPVHQLASWPSRLCIFPPTQDRCVYEDKPVLSTCVSLRGSDQPLTCRFSAPWVEAPPPAKAAAPREGIAAILRARTNYSTCRFRGREAGRVVSRLLASCKTSREASAVLVVSCAA